MTPLQRYQSDIQKTELKKMINSGKLYSVLNVYILNSIFLSKKKQTS